MVVYIKLAVVVVDVVHKLKCKSPLFYNGNPDKTPEIQIQSKTALNYKETQTDTSLSII